jgi:hypothetical protein
MSEFRSAYSGHVRHTSLTGNGHEPEYEYKVTETGRELVKTGENDVYALIQSRLEETKIENIIKRATYDPTALGGQEWQNSAQMVDITDVPTDYHTWYNRIEDAKKQFEALPIEVKNKWDNDVEKYVMAYGTIEWADKMGLLKEEKPAENTTEKKEGAE